MNITSYNITEVAYHYIGLRVLGGMGSSVERSQQVETISSNILKFVGDRALRLMLPGPRGTFQTVGEKVCQELVHFGFARSERGSRYELTAMGRMVLDLLSERQYVQLRQVMAYAHLKAYDNLRATLQAHLDGGPIWQPVVTSNHLDWPSYAARLLEPTFGDETPATVIEMLGETPLPSPKKLEDILRAEVLSRAMPGQKIRVALFRAICDRLVSLRLLNKPRVVHKDCEFEKSYSPCLAACPAKPWYAPLEVPLANSECYRIYMCEPDPDDPDYQNVLLSAIDQGLTVLSPEGGYHDIPDLRDWVCEYLSVPEAAFDDGLICLLNRQPAVLSVGLQYEKITGRRRPLVRPGQSIQLHNLIRRV